MYITLEELDLYGDYILIHNIADQPRGKGGIVDPTPANLREDQVPCEIVAVADEVPDKWKERLQPGLHVVVYRHDLKAKVELLDHEDPESGLKQMYWIVKCTAVMARINKTKEQIQADEERWNDGLNLSARADEGDEPLSGVVDPTKANLN